MRAETPWSPGRKIAFRFGFSYLALYLYPFSSTLGWFWWFWVHWTNQTPWDRLVPWVAANVLHVGPATASTATGDSTYDHVRVFCSIVIAAGATVIWSLLDRRRPNYSRLSQWLRWYMRLVLAYTLIGFGTYKIIPVQVGPPSLMTLIRPYGDVSPSVHFWNFLGASTGFQIFAGLVETLSGVLLLVPGLTLFGALAALGALVNVLTMSGFYDVSVKLGVLHLVLLAALLVLPDVPRVVNLLVLKRRTEPEQSEPLFRRRFVSRSVWAIQWALGLFLMVMMLSQGKRIRHEMTTLPLTTPLYGIWRVDEFEADGELRPPLLTDSLRWQRVIVESRPGLTPRMIALVQGMDGRFSPPYIAEADTLRHTLSLYHVPDADLLKLFVDPQYLLSRAGATRLDYSRPSPGEVTLTGPMDGRRLRVVLEKEKREFILTTQGFHWIIDEKDITNFDRLIY